MSLLLTAGLLLTGCAAAPPSTDSAALSFVGERATRAIAADAVKLLLQRLSPARTTLQWDRPTLPEQAREAAFLVELARQLRVEGYALWEPAAPAVTPEPARGAQMLKATLRPLGATGGVFCAVVRVDESQWARCYKVAADNVWPAGGWSHIVLPAGTP